MLLEIDLSPDTPIYLQIAAAVRAALAAGRLTSGDRLPTGRDVSSALGVNLDTVQRAYRTLADEGLVVSRVGRGTRVVDEVDREALDLGRHVADLVARAATIGVSPERLADMVMSAAIG